MGVFIYFVGVCSSFNILQFRLLRGVCLNSKVEEPQKIFSQPSSKHASTSHYGHYAHYDHYSYYGHYGLLLGPSAERGGHWVGQPRQTSVLLSLLSPSLPPTSLG